ncbi:hypothetical protein WMY93_028394 [Mugilogobius chulae]|uniref:PiggyBac transposable element-derived protein domain-containing protein n=1 Tax=Mugilogobius chulae TaxID=88201 RepID=A0AAW0MRS1_9GOBI
MADAQTNTEEAMEEEPETKVMQEEDVEVHQHHHYTRKRRKTVVEAGETPTTSKTSTCSSTSGETRAKQKKRGRKRTKESLEEQEEQRQVKAEPEPWWANNEDSGPECEALEPGASFGDSEDDTCSRENGENRSSEDEQLKWQTRSAPDTQLPALKFKPARTPGPAVSRSSSWTPLSLFQLFFSSSVVGTIVENTNKNAAHMKHTTTMKDMRNWTNITVKDFYIHLATILYTSLVNLQEEKDYWKECFPYGLSFPGKTCSRNQFKKIRRALSLCDPEKDEENESKRDTPEYDKLFKIKPFFNEMVNACKSHFQPHSNICINERNVTKNQPLTCGFALFSLADSQTGYTWNLHIYTGKTAETRKQSVAQTAVAKLLPVSLLGSGFTLYTDSLFSSPNLFKELREKNIGCCGILNKHHPEFPKTSQNDFPSPASRGDIRWIRKDRLLFVKWIDTREVSMCSTVHEAFTGQVMKRPVREAKGMVAKQFPCPVAVADFYRHMIVPDKTDLSKATASCHTKDFILYKELAKLKDNAALKYVTENRFREDLCRELLKFGTGADPDAPSKPAFDCCPLFYNENNDMDERKRCRRCHKKTLIYCEKCEWAGPLSSVANSAGNVVEEKRGKLCLRCFSAHFLHHGRRTNQHRRVNERGTGDKAIKEEREDVEVHQHHHFTRKRRKTVVEANGETPSTSKTSTCSSTSGETRAKQKKRGRKRTKESLEEQEEQRQVKAEPEPWWANNEDSGPECEALEPGAYFGDSEDDTCNGENGESRSSGDEQLKWQTRSAPDTQLPALKFKPARTPGPAVSRSSSWTPLSLFQLFFSSSVVRTIVETQTKMQHT